MRVAIEDRCGATTPAWLRAVSFCESLPPSYFIEWIGPIGTMYLAVAPVLIVVCLLIGPNSNSLHRLYRDRLSRAFLFERRNMGDRDAPSTVDRWTFSSLKPRTPDDSDWMLAAAYAPYLLINTAINLEGSKELNKRGRNADTFVFSPLAVGSRFTRYVPTEGHGSDGSRSQPRLGNGDVGRRGIRKHGAAHHQGADLQPHAPQHSPWLLACQSIPARSCSSHWSQSAGWRMSAPGTSLPKRSA